MPETQYAPPASLGPLPPLTPTTVLAPGITGSGTVTPQMLQELQNAQNGATTVIEQAIAAPLAAGIGNTAASGQSAVNSVQTAATNLTNVAKADLQHVFVDVFFIGVILVLLYAFVSDTQGYQTIVTTARNAAKDIAASGVIE